MGTSDGISKNKTVPGNAEQINLYDEAVVGRVFSLFYSSSDIVGAIDTTLKLMGEYYDLSRVYIFEERENATVFANTFEWCADGVEPQQDFLSYIRFDSIGGRELYYSNFDRSGTFYCPDINVLPEEQKAVLAPQGIFAMLQCAIIDNGDICGMIGFDECRENRRWTDKQVGTLMFVSRIVSLFLTKLRQSDGLLFSADFRAALDYNAAYVYLINPDSCEVVYTNKAIQSSFRENYIGKTCYREFTGREAPCENCPAITVRKTGYPCSAEIWRSDGLLMLSQASPLRWNGQDLIMLSCIDITERSKAQHELMAEKKKTELALSATSLSVWTYDLESDVLELTSSGKNPFAKAAKIAGGCEAFIEQGYILPESLKAYRELHEKIKGGAATASAVIRFNKDLLRSEWMKITYTAVENADGRYTSAIAIGEDITEQILAQQRYRREEEYRKNLESDCVLTMRVNLTKNRVEYAHNTGVGLSFSGNTYDELLPKYVSLVSDEDERKKASDFFARKELLAAFARGDMSRSTLCCVMLPGGMRRYISAEVRLSEHPFSGDITAFVAMRDKTDETLISLIMDKIIETDYDYVAYVSSDTGSYRLFASQTAAVMLDEHGDDFDEVTRRMVKKYSDPEDTERIIEETRLSYVLKKLELSDEYIYVYRSSESEGGRTRQLVFRTFDGDKSRLMVTRQDVTKLVEEARENNEKLAEALRSAEKANEAKSDFLSRMSHDIRTPLNAVIGLTALAFDEPDVPEVIREYLLKIESSGKFLLGLINDILDMSRIESGSIVFRPEHYEYAEFASMLMATFGSTCRQKKLSFTMTGEIENGGILADKVKLNQIFLNIISNAVKYTPEGGNISLEVRAALPRGGMLPCDFYVTDTGIGMSDEFQRHMFEPFSQEQQRFSTKVEGTGLGLSIAKNLVELMGGSLTIKSGLGKGTTVHVHLEFVLDSAAAATEQSRTVQAEAALNNRYILLAEDNEINSQIAKKILENKGMRVCCAYNGEEAVRIFSESEPFSFDAVFMDIRMPVLDGLGAARRIRALPRKDADCVPIIAMTANAFEEDKRLSLEAGMNAHLDKPIEPQSIYRTLCELIK